MFAFLACACPPPPPPPGGCSASRSSRIRSSAWALSPRPPGTVTAHGRPGAGPPRGLPGSAWGAAEPEAGFPARPPCCPVRPPAPASPLLPSLSLGREALSPRLSSPRLEGACRGRRVLWPPAPFGRPGVPLSRVREAWRPAGMQGQATVPCNLSPQPQPSGRPPAALRRSLCCVVGWGCGRAAGSGSSWPGAEPGGGPALPIFTVWTHPRHLQHPSDLRGRPRQAPPRPGGGRSRPPPSPSPLPSAPSRCGAAATTAHHTLGAFGARVSRLNSRPSLSPKGPVHRGRHEAGCGGSRAAGGPGGRQHPRGSPVSALRPGLWPGCARAGLRACLCPCDSRETLAHWAPHARLTPMAAAARRHEFQAAR